MTDKLFGLMLAGQVAEQRGLARRIDAQGEDLRRPIDAQGRELVASRNDCD